MKRERVVISPLWLTLTAAVLAVGAVTTLSLLVVITLGVVSVLNAVLAGLAERDAQHWFNLWEQARGKP